jgi:hypothetical protein
MRGALDECAGDGKPPVVRCDLALANPVVVQPTQNGVGLVVETEPCANAQRGAEAEQIRDDQAVAGRSEQSAGWHLKWRTWHQGRAAKAPGRRQSAGG